MTTSRRVTSRLPFGELTVAAIQRLLDKNGYAYVDGVPEEFDHVEFLRQIGPLMPQYDGELIWSIKAQKRFDELYHSLNTKPLLPHTECYEFTGTPPKYLALWCLVPTAEGGQTTLADMYGFVDTLTEQERARLAGNRFRFFSSSGVQDMELGREAEHPFIERRPQRPTIIRFSRNNVDAAGDDLLPRVLGQAVEYFDREHVAITFETRALLVWDNHRMVHSRTGYDDRRRHLRRVWLRET